MISRVIIGQRAVDLNGGRNFKADGILAGQLVTQHLVKLFFGVLEHDVSLLISLTGGRCAGLKRPFPVQTNWKTDLVIRFTFSIIVNIPHWCKGFCEQSAIFSNLHKRGFFSLGFYIIISLYIARTSNAVRRMSFPARRAALAARFSHFIVKGVGNIGNI